MRILLSAFGSRGDALRFVVLARELLRRGHDVVMCGYAEHAWAAEGTRVVYVPCASPRTPSLVSAPDLVVATAEGSIRVDEGTPLRVVCFAPAEVELRAGRCRDRTILAADPQLVTLPPALAGRVVQVPAILPAPKTVLPYPIEAFLAEGEPPVYVGFGATRARDPDLLTRDLVAAVRGLGVRAILDRGCAGIGREGLNDVLVVDEAPHAALFPHCAAVVHHGGAGTTARVCRSGVPHVVVPQSSRQHFWAERIAALGLGERLARRHLTGAALFDRLGRVLGDEAFAFRAAAMAERLRTADGAAAAADAVLA